MALTITVGNNQSPFFHKPFMTIIPNIVAIGEAVNAGQHKKIGASWPTSGGMPR